MDADLQTLLAAWASDEFDKKTIVPVLQRLKSDDAEIQHAWTVGRP